MAAPSTFSRSSGAITPDFIPDKGWKLVPTGSSEQAMADATKAVKLKTKRDKKEEAGSLVPFIVKMDSLSPANAIAFLADDMPPVEFRRYIEAEKASKNRAQVLGHFGQI